MTVDEPTREEKLIDLRDDVALEETLRKMRKLERGDSTVEEVLKDMERGRDASQEER
jgi:hypothetical protein